MLVPHWHSFTLEKVVKVSLRLTCPFCSARLGPRGRCKFAGCHSNVASKRLGDVLATCCALFSVADETGEAQLVVKGKYYKIWALDPPHNYRCHWLPISDEEDLRRILHFSRLEWNLLLHCSLSSGSELVYLCREDDGEEEDEERPKQNADVDSAVFSLFKMRCKLLGNLHHGFFEALARPFKEDQSYFGPSLEARTLYSLQVRFREQLS